MLHQYLEEAGLRQRKIHFDSGITLQISLYYLHGVVLMLQKCFKDNKAVL